MTESIWTRITSINVERMWWFSVVVIFISIAYLIYNVVWWKRSEGFWVQALDIGMSVFVIALLWQVRRMRAESAWRKVAVWIFLLLMLVMMDIYYFAALPVLGHTACYVVGVMTTGVLLLLPGRIYLPAILVNHAVFCIWLLSVPGPNPVIALMDGTAGVVIAGLASRFLFRTTWSNLSKEQVIEARNAELADSNTELVNLNEEMNDLMAIAAHDLRSPLQGQKNLLELLRTRSNLSPEKASRIMETAIADCQGMLALVSRLLDAHQAETRAGALELERHDLCEVAQTAAQKAETRAAEKNIRLETQLPAHPVVARIHAPALEEVLENLLGNALKFSPAGSTVSLEIHEGPQIVVRDEGPGIPPSEEEFLFRKFHRGINRPTAGEPSTGMGLFIVKKLMEAMGGSVSCQTGEARGAVFHLRFAERNAADSLAPSKEVLTAVG
jgi:signal transduction histidine kinase